MAQINIKMAFVNGHLRDLYYMELEPTKLTKHCSKLRNYGLLCIILCIPGHESKLKGPASSVVATQCSQKCNSVGGSPNSVNLRANEALLPHVIRGAKRGPK